MFFKNVIHKNTKLKILPVKFPFLTIMALLCLAGLVGIFGSLFSATQDYVEKTTIQIASRYTEAIREFRSLYTSEVVAKAMLGGIEVTHDYDLKKNAIPLPATLSMELGKRLGALGTGAKMRLYSSHPFPWRKDGDVIDEFELLALEKLTKNPSQPFFRFETANGQPILRYATADLMQQACVQCHNSHPDTPKKDWRAGDVRGVLEVTLPVGAAGGSLAGLNQAFIISIILSLLGLIVVGMVIARHRRNSTLLAANAKELQEARDILEVRVEERTRELEQSEERKRSIIESAMDAIITIDGDGLVIEYNPSAVEMFGYEPAEVIGKPIADIIIPEYLRQAHSDGIQKFLETGQNTIFGKPIELPAINKSGIEFPVELTVTPSLLGNRPIFNAFLRDITQRKEAEESILAAKNAADEANQAKSSFLSSMSHELRTPLNAILGFGQLMSYNEKEPLTKMQKDNIEQILKGGSHLLTLIDELLDLSKIESGNVSLSIEPVSIHHIISDCIEMTNKISEEFGIIPNEPKLNSDFPDMLADYTRVKQVLINFLTNAIKYNRVGGTVSIDCETVEDNRIRISVIDTGPGIPLEKQSELFQPFNRLGQEGTEIEGTGIGLALAKRLVEKMDGFIGHKSVENEGSTFWFELPIVSDDQAIA